MPAVSCHSIGLDDGRDKEGRVSLSSGDLGLGHQFAVPINQVPQPAHKCNHTYDVCTLTIAGWESCNLCQIPTRPTPASVGHTNVNGSSS
jgi:hypothetical protein